MIGIDIAIALVALTALAAAWRILRGPSDPDRAVAADLLYFAVIGLIALIGVRLAASATFDILVVATLVGLVAALSLARALTGGRR